MVISICIGTGAILSHKEGVAITILLILQMRKVRHQEKFNLSKSIAVRQQVRI